MNGGKAGVKRRIFLESDGGPRAAVLAAVAARMSYRIEWVATSEPADFVDVAKQVRFPGFRATARLKASVEIPSTRFSWQSDPMATSSASFAVIGDEANGRYVAP